ncbi:hypothetical protein AB0G04_25960 [Actinoplanes sp. NPDC023801]
MKVLPGEWIFTPLMPGRAMSPVVAVTGAGGRVTTPVLRVA